MRCMKMPRSLCENENVQFVQELAEVDGPFESPININFKDLTKLELPSLAWHRNDSCPKKMKITNTGHTIIISAKWKCERPYITGGPLLGKYVFSQIHFHWGQNNCAGSEHQVCGMGFPLEMHVAHFKTDYVTQECALREKDGMVVLVYLFKLQDEPNAGLKKIISALPSVKNASTSHAVDPRPILSLCNPFTDDFFMYWGSVVTSTCAHILLWIVCREPFGISPDQVDEFRKILDPSQQPICQNNRHIQPLHKRNVFHVNASKHQADPLLPIKKMLGCFCKKSDDHLKSTTNDCTCQLNKNQEDIEGNNAESLKKSSCVHNKGKHPVSWEISLGNGFSMPQSVFVHNAAVKSAPLLPKILGNDFLKLDSDSLNQTKSEGNSNSKLVSQSCCFILTKEDNKAKNWPEKIRIRKRKRPLTSMGALWHIIKSLEVLKKHTLKKLKEIESINREIKGMKSFCEDVEDKRWLRKIEKIISRQKHFTIRSSQGCFQELKKLAKECNFDKFFDNKGLSAGDNGEKKVWANDPEITEALPCSDVCVKKTPDNAIIKNVVMKPNNMEKIAKYSEKAQRLIQSFFEDIKESEGLHQNLRKNLKLKKLGSLPTKQVEDGNSATSLSKKGYITQKMFNLGNFGNRFFTEVTSEDVGKTGKVWVNKKTIISLDRNPNEESSNIECCSDNYDLFPNGNLDISDPAHCKNKKDIPLHRVYIAISPSDTKEFGPTDYVSEVFPRREDHNMTHIEILTDKESTSDREKMWEAHLSPRTRKSYFNQPFESSNKKEIQKRTNEKKARKIETDDILNKLQYSSSNISINSIGTQRMIFAKFRKKHSKKTIWKQKSSVITKTPSRGLYKKRSFKRHKLKNINFEGYYIKKRSQKIKKIHKRTKISNDGSSCDASTTSREETKVKMSKPKHKRLTKAKFKLEIEKTSDSTLESTLEYSLISPRRKKLRLECKKITNDFFKGKTFLRETSHLILAKSDDKTLQMASHINNKLAQNTKDSKNKERHWMISKITDANNQQKILTKVHIPRSSANESSRAPSRLSSHRTLRASSADSRSTCLGVSKSNTQGEKILISETTENDIAKKDEPFVVKRLITKNKSLTHLVRIKPSSSELTHRFFTENLEDRQKSAREVLDFTKKFGNKKWLEESSKSPAVKTLSLKASNKTYRKSDEGRELRKLSRKFETKEKFERQDRKLQQHNVGFLMSFNEVDEEIRFKTQLPDAKAKNPVRRGVVEKYHFLNKELQEVKTLPQLPGTEETQSVQLESDRLNTPDILNMKGDAELFSNSDKKELQTSVSYSKIKINTQSRPHSAESLTSLTKAFKRKSKKRPHCCKIISRHRIRKNPSILRKPMKVESKASHFLGLTDEEQLKIISANVAKYLKQKLVGDKNNSDFEKNCIFQEIKQAVLDNIKEFEDKPKENIVKQVSCSAESEDKQDVLNVKTSEKVNKEQICETKIFKLEKAQVKSSAESTKETKLNSKPVHNFIKLNKIMAGKYKRLAPGEKKLESHVKIKEELKKESPKPRTKFLKKKKEKISSPKQAEQPKNKIKSGSPTMIPVALEKLNTNKTPKGNQVKTPETFKKIESKSKKSCQDSTSATTEKAKCEENPKEVPSSSLALQKIPQAKKRWVPAYMLTSYLPAPIEIIEHQQQKLNRYLLSVQKSCMETYLPEVLYETKTKLEKKEFKSDSILAKDLEYSMKLQMSLNNEVSENIENSMNYVKTLLSQNYNGTTTLEKPSPNEYLDIYDSYNKGIVFIEMNDILGSSSSSSEGIIYPEPGMFCTRKQLGSSQSKCKLKYKEISELKASKESGDSEIINPTEFDAQEGYNSDSSYNYEISITINSGVNEKESKIQFYDPIACAREFVNNCTNDLRQESETNKATNRSEGGPRPHRKKRMESEISLEMKQKLLEILEKEIKREMALTYDMSSDNSSDGLPLKSNEDSDAMNRSQSTDSSCDNIEVLTLISDTMRQYLTDFKDRRLAQSTDDRETDEKDKNVS